MSNNIIFKKALIAALSSVQKADESLEKNQLTLFTANGMVTGNLINPKRIESFDSSDIVFKSLFDGLNKYTLQESLEKSYESFILLKDVTIFNGSFTSNLTYLVVFVDQIIGATIGTIN